MSDFEGLRTLKAGIRNGLIFRVAWGVEFISIVIQNRLLIIFPKLLINSTTRGFIFHPSNLA